MPEKKHDDIVDAAMYGRLHQVRSEREELRCKHDVLRNSHQFQNASAYTHRLVAHFAVGLHCVGLMSTRCEGFKEQSLSLGIQDHLIQSAVSIMAMIREGMHGPARREMRFIIEASTKALWCDTDDRLQQVQQKVEALDDLGSERFTEVVGEISPKLLDDTTRDEFHQHVMNLYGQLSTYVHISRSQIEYDLRRFEGEQYFGFETIAEVNKLNKLFRNVLDVALACQFEAFDHALVGDIFVLVLDEEPDWVFHKSRLLKAISEHFEYKAERKARTQD